MALQCLDELKGLMEKELSTERAQKPTPSFKIGSKNSIKKNLLALQLQQRLPMQYRHGTGLHCVSLVAVYKCEYYSCLVVSGTSCEISPFTLVMCLTLRPSKSQ